MTEHVDTDVAIVGVGPVGAVLAGLLGQHGIDVVAVDREWDVFKLPRAAHIDHTGVRTLQELGMLDSLMPTLLANAGLDFVTADNQLLLRVPGGAQSISGIPASMYFHQPDLDQRIRAAVAAMPSVDLRLGTEVRTLEPGPESVTLHCERSGAEPLEIRAKWVVGCDGAWSTTREALGLELDDLGFEERWIVVDLLLQQAAADQLGGSAICLCDPERPTYSIPMPNLRHRFEFMSLPGEDPAQMIADDSIIRLVSGWMDAGGFEIERSAVYTFHGLVASHWRHGRVLIAGDAAHQMPPFLGQGMCSGIRDAANLAWKLRHMLDHGAADELLDTYGIERATHVRQIIEAVVDYGRFICTIDPVEAAERDRRLLSDPAPADQRMRFGLPLLHRGLLVHEHGGGLFVQPRPGDGPMLDDLVGPRFAVVGRTRAALGAAGAWWADAVGAFVAVADEVPFHAATLTKWLNNRSADVVLVRPDRYVMWAGNDLDTVTRDVAPLLSGTAYAGSKVEEKIR